MSAVSTLDWCVILPACAYVCALVTASPAANPLAPAALLTSLTQAGAFNLIAWVMIWRRVNSLPHARAALPAWITLAVVVGLVSAIPSDVMIGLALVIFGLALLRSRPATLGLTQAGTLVLALAASIGSPQLRFFHLAVGRLDAVVVAALLRLQGVDVIVSGNIIADGNARIEVLAACASSAALPGFVLAYVIIAIALRDRLHWSDLPWLLATSLSSIALTEIRLSLMVPSEADWNFWHNGWGLTMYELVALSFACLFPVLAGMRLKIRTMEPRPAE